MNYVLDASALVALFLNETGADRVQSRLADGAISAVNLVEAVTRLTDKGIALDDLLVGIAGLGLEVVSFDYQSAVVTSSLRASTRHLGLSLGDRACLALAIETGAIALTSDRAWATLDVGCEIELIR